MEVLEQKNNPLLDREELIISLESSTIPSKTEITKQISEQVKKPEENIVIEKINTQFGSHNMKIDVKVYNDAKSKEKYETITRKARKKILEETKKAAEEKKKAEEEAKKTTEVVKEETKVEEKPVEAPKAEATSNVANDNKVNGEGSESNKVEEVNKPKETKEDETHPPKETKEELEEGTHPEEEPSQDTKPEARKAEEEH